MLCYYLGGKFKWLEGTHFLIQETQDTEVLVFVNVGPLN